MKTIKTDYARIFLYLLFFIGLLFLRFTLSNGEPLGLALTFAMSRAGLSPFLSALLFFLTSFIDGSGREILLYALQGTLLAIGFLLRDRLKRANLSAYGLPPFLCLALALTAFSLFAPFTPYYLPFDFLSGATLQKILISALIFLLSAVFSVAVSALLKKLLKCRLQAHELVFSVFFFVCIGVGVCRFIGLNAYMGIAFFALLLFSCATKDTTTLVCAFTLSLPPLLMFSLSPERFFIYGVAVALFIKSGRLSASCALLAVFFSYGYVDGLYAYPTNQLVPAILSAVLPALFFVLIPTPIVRELENKLVFYREKHLSRVAINRNRSAIGQQLFEISGVFREIQNTFTTLSTTEAEDSAKEYIRACMVEETCRSCTQYRNCARKGAINDLSKLIEIGCQKGRASLIDLPKTIADMCVNQSGILYSVNRQIGDYQRYMTETENASSGRALLANQAQGVSEILRDLALEQSEPLRMYTDKERALSIALLGVGIVCSEVLVYGDENNLTLSLVTYGRADVKKISAVASHTLDTPMLISKRLTLGNDKFCCILHKKPRFDAAFGVATTRKTGETASGDTHSVIKIDERRFMVALSDGMGSGEYARRISESTISLLESFYRAKMPPETILKTVNKLLTFNKEESFACVDIAVVDLDDGVADIVKIGSPVGFILSGNTVKVLENGTLPLGILDSLHPTSATYELLENDILLFLSDGITGAFGSTTDLYDILKSIPVHNPQELADLLLKQALTAYGGVAKDDMTAVAVRLFKCA